MMVCAIQALLIVFCALYCTVSARPPLYMAGPMTGPGQVPWDADLGVPLVWNDGIWFLEGDCFQNGDRKRAIMPDGNISDSGHALVGQPSGGRVAGNAIGGCTPLPCKVDWYLDGNANPIMFITWPPNVLSCVPAGSVEANGITYIWMMNVVQWGGYAETHAWSMLLSGTPTPANYQATSCYFGIDSKFVNAAFINMGNFIFIYGTGLYRASPIFLARVPPNEIENCQAWEYYVALDQWSPNQALALPIILADSGEISAIYSTYLQQYVVTAFDFPTGLYMHRSDNPWGPWTSEEIFNELWGYNWLSGLSGGYGGYMVPDQGKYTSTLWMTFSFWTPYRTYMLSTDLSQLNSTDPTKIITSVTDMKTGASLHGSPAPDDVQQDMRDMTRKAEMLRNANKIN